MSVVPDRATAPPWPNEIDLLLACARREMRDTDVARARMAVASGLDWDLVLRAAYAHGLTPLIHCHAAAGRVAVPAEVLGGLKRLSKRIAHRNLRLTAALVSVLRASAAAGLTMVPLKGPMLAERLYGSVALRRILDVDLLVSPRDVATATALLESLGYHLVAAPGADSPHRAASHHVRLVSAGRSHVLELHRYLLSPSGGRRIALDAIHPRLRSASVAGVPAPELAPEDLVVYLCLHGSAHGWTRLEWLAAVGELCRSGAVADWGLVWDTARAWGGERRVRATLTLVRRLLDPDAPPIAGADRWVDWATSGVSRRLGVPTDAGPRWRDLFVYNLLTDDSGRDRVRRCGMALRYWSADAAQRLRSRQYDRARA